MFTVENMAIVAAAAIGGYLIGLWSKRRNRDPREVQLAREKEASDTRKLVAGLPADVRTEVDALIRAKAKIHAIKLVHDKFGWSLRVSKDVIDARENELGL